MKVIEFCCLSTIFAVIAFVSGVNATPLSRDVMRDALPASAPELIDEQPEMAPIAFLRFCIMNEAQCRGESRQSRLNLTIETWRILHSVNASVNARIIPDPSKGAYDWSADATAGNCNDYAVQKQKALLALGLPISALSLTTAETQQGVGHLVVIVRTDRGDFVLDNLRPEIVAWNRTGYRWLKRQSFADPRTWVSINPMPERASASWRPAASPNVNARRPDRRRVLSELMAKQFNFSMLGVFDTHVQPSNGLQLLPGVIA
jgi:predicted transglutaminase-like cysteine proteinase